MSSRDPSARVRVVAVSDTHGKLDQIQVPDGDILIHAGDWTVTGGLDELRSDADALRRLPHPDKIVIAGNHDVCFQRHLDACLEILGREVTYLQDSGVERQGVSVYGSPWGPWGPLAGDLEMAFSAGPIQIRRTWNAIPANTDILVTHVPPWRILDTVRRPGLAGRLKTLFRPTAGGCPLLRDEVFRKRPLLHVFGHIHESSGVLPSRERTMGFVNASVLDDLYRPSCPPTVLHL